MPIDSGFWDPALVNYVLDPGFESGSLLPFDYADAAGNWTAGLILEGALDGNVSLQLNVPAPVGSPLSAPFPGSLALLAGWAAPAAPGQTWSYACRAAPAAASLAAGVGIGFATADPPVGSLEGLVLASSGPQDTPTGLYSTAPQTIYIDGAVAPANARYVVAVHGIVQLTAEAAGPVLFDDRVLTPTATHSLYFSGDDGGAYWQGQRFWSPSQRYGLPTEQRWLENGIMPDWFYSTPRTAGG